MFKEIMKQLREKLKEVFPEAVVYEEFVRQGFERPCFFLHIDGVEARREVGNRYLFAVKWRVSYYPLLPSAGDINAAHRDLHETALKLYGVFNLPGYLTHRIEHEIDGKVLQFSLKYSFYAAETDIERDLEKMIELKLEME